MLLAWVLLAWVHAMARLERVFVSSRKTSLLIMLGNVLQSSCRMKMDVMMMPGLG